MRWFAGQPLIAVRSRTYTAAATRPRLSTRSRAGRLALVRDNFHAGGEGVARAHGPRQRIQSIRKILFELAKALGSPLQDVEIGQRRYTGANHHRAVAWNRIKLHCNGRSYAASEQHKKRDAPNRPAETRLDEMAVDDLDQV